MSRRLRTLAVAATAVTAAMVAAPLSASAAVPSVAHSASAAAKRLHPYAPGPFGIHRVPARAAASPKAVRANAAPAAAPASVITNGGFETGDLTGFTADTMYAGQTVGGINPVYAYSGTESQSGYVIPAPAAGTYAGILDDGANGMGSEVLYQDIAVPATGGTLSLDYAYQSFAPLASPNTLAYTGTAPNQQFRIDVIKTSADDRSLATGDVLATVFATTAASPMDTGNAYLPVTANLSALAGQTVRLRMVIADNQDSMLANVDALTFTPSPATALPEAPEAALLPLAALAVIGGLGFARKRRLA